MSQRRSVVGTNSLRQSEVFSCPNLKSSFKIFSRTFEQRKSSSSIADSPLQQKEGNEFDEAAFHTQITGVQARGGGRAAFI